MSARSGADEAYDAEGNVKRTLFSTNGAFQSLSAGDVLELRRLIDEDAYDTVRVADKIARRMMFCDDL